MLGKVLLGPPRVTRGSPNLGGKFLALVHALIPRKVVTLTAFNTNCSER